MVWNRFASRRRGEAETQPRTTPPSIPENPAEGDLKCREYLTGGLGYFGPAEGAQPQCIRMDWTDFGPIWLRQSVELVTPTLNRQSRFR